MTTDDVRRAAARLPDELREVYVQFALDGRSYVEIADALGIPKATVGTRLSRARARLKQLLTAELAEGGR
jgi:RNA polymerase sigma-70 factor (ECF subfamily)